MFNIALSTLETAINKYLRLDPKTIIELKRLQGKTVQITLTDWDIRFYIQPSTNGINLLPFDENTVVDTIMIFLSKRRFFPVKPGNPHRHASDLKCGGPKPGLRARDQVAQGSPIQQKKIRLSRIRTFNRPKVFINLKLGIFFNSDKNFLLLKMFC